MGLPRGAEEEGPMTRKRDLKRRVRERQARTGESYVTARRGVVAQRESSSEPTPIDVDVAIDVTEAAQALGLKCRVLIYERLARDVDPVRALAVLRDVLDATTDDPAMDVMRGVIAGNVAKAPHRPFREREFLLRVRAGLTGVSLDGRVLALHVEGRSGLVTVLCATWRQSATLLLLRHEDSLSNTLSRLGVGVLPVGISATDDLFLIYQGRRYPITREPFVIGRHRSSDLQIRDGHISRKHAAVIWRNGAHYMVDLGSHAGVEYRGVKIEDRRIEEGDLFKLADYAVRFTFLETDG
jgi:hypothetical protein